MVKKKTQVSHCITRVTSTQVEWKKHHFLLNLSYVTLIKSFICWSRIELKYWIVDVCEEKDTRLPGWVSAHGEQSDERETSSGNCQHFQVLPPGLYPFGKIRLKFTNIVLIKNTKYTLKSLLLRIKDRSNFSLRWKQFGLIRKIVQMMVI